MQGDPDTREYAYLLLYAWGSEGKLGLDPPTRASQCPAILTCLCVHILHVVTAESLCLQK